MHSVDSPALSGTRASGRSQHAASARPLQGHPRLSYLLALTWMFSLFNSLRIIAYLPTVWAIHASGDTSQHSIWTWAAWLGANITMAAWLHEHNGHRFDSAVIVSLGNAAMCAITLALILAYRSSLA